MKLTGWILGFTFLFLPALALAYPMAISGQRVYDGTGYMPDNSRRAALNAELLAFEQAHAGLQVAVVTVPSTEGQTLEEYGNGIFRFWGIGQRGQNNGVLLLISRQADASGNKTRIEVGYGLEGELPDAVCSRIINEVIRPIAHDRHDPQGAIEAGAHDILRRLGGDSVRQGTFNAHPASTEGDSDRLSQFMFVILAAVVIVMLLFFLTNILVGYFGRRREQRELRKMCREARAWLEGSKAAFDAAVSRALSQLKRLPDKQRVFDLQKEAGGHVLHAISIIDDVSAQIELSGTWRSRSSLDAVGQSIAALRSLTREVEGSVLRAAEHRPNVERQLAETSLSMTAAVVELGRYAAMGFRLDPHATIKPAGQLIDNARQLMRVEDEAQCDLEGAEDKLAQVKAAITQTLFGWRSRVDRQAEIESGLKTAAERLKSLSGMLIAARINLQTLKEAYIPELFVGFEDDIERQAGLLKELDALRRQVAEMNTFERQEFEAADRTFESLKTRLNVIEDVLRRPGEQLRLIYAARASIPSKVQEAESDADRLLKLETHADVTSALKVRLCAAREALDEIQNPDKLARINWIMFSQRCDDLLAGAGIQIRAAEKEIKAEEDRRRREREDEERRRRESYESSFSSSSSSGSSFDSGGGFGGGDSGGGGASGGFD